MWIQGEHLSNPTNFSYLMVEIRSKKQLIYSFLVYYFNIKIFSLIKFPVTIVITVQPLFLKNLEFEISCMCTNLQVCVSSFVR